ncbi:SGNH/GDSL hydrolase family protein [Solihabitans fulvus]|uniref:SGNH/GDSL hydrolase family protein n=1 Tax=Solihabitans fulvus TaxID=1892852 RepID=A0A5B2XKE5_9PSEU|nr:SGNH/GDSL hydrolase family protein [Solihabitans fulvus]KAA2263242.1 SGNH/GDSL hydrolase family protein [Solihabitans fulvus]
MTGFRAVRSVVLTAGALGGLSGVAYGLFMEQSKRARLVIGVPEDPPLHADGVYLPDGTGPVPLGEHDGPTPLRFGVFGDSSAAGVGVESERELPGVLLAVGLAEEAERPVLLTTYAISGATTPDLAGQVDGALAERADGTPPVPPEVALVIIGANDVTDTIPIRSSARMLATEVERLRAAGVGVVVGTCPDLGAILPIPQPLRSVARTWSLTLGRTQRRAVDEVGGTPVPLADLLSPEFLARPGELFSPDRFHPNAAGYEAAAAVLLAPLCSVAGVWSGGPLPALPRRSATAEANRPTTKAIAWLNRLNRRQDSPLIPS